MGIPEWRRTTAAESFQLYRPEQSIVNRVEGTESHDILETPLAHTSAQARGPMILLSPLSLLGPSPEAGPSCISRDSRPPDLEWLDPELDNLPDFEWGWDKGLQSRQSDTQRESLTIWRQSLSGSQSQIQRSKEIRPPEGPSERMTTGMVSYLTDPSIVDETVTQANPTLGSGPVESHYQPLPLRLAPFEIPTVKLSGPSVLPPKEPPAKQTKSRKKAAKQNMPETIKDVKPMKQELSPFVLRSLHQEPEALKMADATHVDDNFGALSALSQVDLISKPVTDVDASRLTDAGVVHPQEPKELLRDSPEAMPLQDQAPSAACSDKVKPWMKTHRSWARDLISRDRRFGKYVDMLPEVSPACTGIWSSGRTLC
jgi:hypothetical protein